MDFDKPKVYGDTSITDGLVTVIVGIIIIIFQHCHLFLLTTFNIRLENCTSLIKERLWFDCWGIFEPDYTWFPEAKDTYFRFAEVNARPQDDV